MIGKILHLAVAAPLLLSAMTAPGAEALTQKAAAPADGQKKTPRLIGGHPSVAWLIYIVAPQTLCTWNDPRTGRSLEIQNQFISKEVRDLPEIGSRTMKDGVIQQVAEPIELYDNPCNKFVAGFIGTPPMNFFEGVITVKDGKLSFVEPGFEFAIPEEWKAQLAPYADKKVTFGVRPEDIGTEEAEKTPNMSRVKAKIEVVEPMGSESYVYLNTGENSFIARVDPHKKLRVGELESLAVLLPKAHFFDGETEKTII